MRSHAPSNYICPICQAIQGLENDATWIKQTDIFYKDDLVMGFISSKAIKGNEGHPLIVPIKHTENIYELSEETGRRIFDVAKKVAITIKTTRNCDGVTLVQNNEPAGDQHTFHYHLHVIPRFTDDQFATELWKAAKSNPEDRIEYAEKLGEALAK